MSKDNRKKGCPNQTCIVNKKKKYQKADVRFCPECGSILVYVCSKCYGEIEDIGPEHKICAHCEAEAEQKKEKIVGGMKKAAQAAAGVVLPIGGAIAAKAAPQVKRMVVNKGSKFIVKAVKNIIK